MATSDLTGNSPQHPPGGQETRAGPTAHEQAEGVLRQSEADLTEAQRVAKLGSWRFDLATNAARWSKELYRIFEIEEQAFDGTYEAFLSCVHPDDRPRVLQTQAEARASGRSFEVEYRVLTRAGQLKTIREVGYAVKDAAGKIVSLFGTAQDITDRKRAEEALQQTNARLQVILGASPIPIFSVTADGWIESWNEAAERVFGWSAKEAIGRLCPTVPPQEMQDYLAMLRRAMQGEPSLGLVRYRQKKGGSLLVCRISAAPQRNAQGQPVGVTVLLEDITEQAQAEAALRESEERLRLLDDNLPDSYVYQYTREADGTRRFLYLSAGVERLHGVKAEAGLRDASVLHRQNAPEQLSALAAAEAASLRDLSDFQMELRICRADGQWRWIQLRSCPRRTPEGQVIWDGVATDITARRRTEEALRQLSGQLLRLQDEERRRLARELHDTTAQKLAVLLLGLKRLTAQASSLDANAQESLAECQALAKQCADELRTFSYLLHPPLLEELGLAGAVRDYADGFAQRSGLRVDLEVSPSLERLPREKELALFRVLQESLANVHRHSGSKKVSIRLTQLRGEIRLEVQDAGHGLELKTDPTSGERAPSKLGVGVAGMRERLRQLGGRLEFESGHPGTTVRASLPFDQPGSKHSDDQNPDCGRS